MTEQVERVSAGEAMRLLDEAAERCERHITEVEGARTGASAVAAVSSAQDPADGAQQTLEHSIDTGMLADARQQMGEIEAARARVADGTYGTCARCAQPIPAERLRAVPWTRFCVLHAARAEQGRTW